MVEYKSSRRKSQTRPTDSIWGKLDLKSVGREVDTVFTNAGSDRQATKESRTQAQDSFMVEASERHNEIAAQPDQRVVVSDPATAVETDPQQSGLVDATSGAVPTEVSAEQLDTSGAAVPEPIQDRYVDPQKERAPRRSRQKTGRLRKAGNTPTGPLAAADAIFRAAPAHELDELAELEAENRRLKHILAAKLQKESVWLREQLQRAR